MSASVAETETDRSPREEVDLDGDDRVGPARDRVDVIRVEFEGDAFAGGITRQRGPDRLQSGVDGTGPGAGGDALVVADAKPD